MKKVILTIILLYTIIDSSAQQNPLYSQFMFNPFVINPAITGTHTYYQIWSNHRLQWIGMVDPPLTNTLSIYGPLEKQDMGIGGYIYSDVTGPSSKIGMNGSYAYNFAVSDEYRLSLGLSLGLMQYKIDGTKIKFPDNFDEALLNNVWTKFLPDASFGVYFYSSNLHAGIASTQLFNNKIKIFEEDTTSGNETFGRLKSHFYLTAGYKYFINRDFAIEPTLILREVVPASPQLDLNVRAIYQNMAWFGVSFRTQDAIALLGGYTYERKIYIGLSYDIGITPLAKFNSGSFEIIIGYKFNSIKD